jgi:hypothetical protein
MADNVAKRLTASQEFPAPIIPLSPRTRAQWQQGQVGPAYNSGMAFLDVGSSGLRQYSGWVREEFLPQLAGREAARVYREMQDNSATIGALMFAINATIRKIEWRVEPAGDDSESAYQAEFIEGCMDDMSHTWSDFVVESLSMLGYGYAPHEIVYKRCVGPRPAVAAITGRAHSTSQFADNKIRWRRLPLRGQETILKWFFGPGNEVYGLTQQPWTGPIVDIPIEKLLLFRASVHKGNPEGRSILRTAYRSYYLAKRMEELEAILFERMGGIPVVYLPKELLDLAANGDPSASAQVETWKKIVTNVRVDEQMGMVLPSDLWPTSTGTGTATQYKFELVTPQGGRGQTVDSEKVIQRYNLNQLASVLADFIQLGHESRGTQSLAMSKTDMFFQATEGFLISNADVINRHGIPRLMELNGLDTTYSPELKPDMPQRTDLDVLSNFLLRLQQAGMPLFPNDTLQEFVLDAAGMPDVTQDDNYQVLSDLKNQQLQANADSATASAENLKNPPQPPGGPPGSPGSNFHKMIAGSIARRLLKMNGATATTGRRRRRRF